MTAGWTISARACDRFVQMGSDSAAAMGREDIDFAEVGVGGGCNGECRGADYVVAVDGQE